MHIHIAILSRVTVIERYDESFDRVIWSRIADYDGKIAFTVDYPYPAPFTRFTV